MGDLLAQRAGWQLVPKEPTPDMQRAYFKAIDKNMARVQSDPRFDRYDNGKEAYVSMLAAAPAAPTGSGE